MKDGRTHLAYKPEHAMDLDSGAVVAAEVHTADQGDTTTLLVTLDSAKRHLAAVGAAPTPDAPAELVTDKAYHTRAVLKDLADGPWKPASASPSATNFTAGMAMRRRKGIRMSGRSRRLTLRIPLPECAAPARMPPCWPIHSQINLPQTRSSADEGFLLSRPVTPRAPAYPIRAMSLARTSANSVALTLPFRAALRARQSWLFTWSASTTLGGVPPIATSNG
jgi:hypothetical protein